MSTADARMALVALTRRELLRLLRQPSRLLSAILTPVVFWVLAGAGLGGSFVMLRAGGGDDGAGGVGGEAAGVAYSSYLLPGMATMVVMFASVMGAISLIQDRHGGFLQSVLVGPTARWTIVASKALAGSAVACAQALLLVVLAVFGGLADAGIVDVFGAGIVLALASFGVIGLGLALAWRVDSVAGFHGVMNLVLLPMWVLSGALFPASGASGWMALVMALNPLHWATLAIGGALGVGEGSAGLAWLGAFGTLLFAIGGMTLAWWVMERSSRVVGAAGER